MARFHRLLEHLPWHLVVATEAGEQASLEFDGGVGDGGWVVPLDVAEFVRVAGVVAPAKDTALVALDHGRHLDTAV